MKTYLRRIAAPSLAVLISATMGCYHTTEKNDQLESKIERLEEKVEQLNEAIVAKEDLEANNREDLAPAMIEIEGLFVNVAETQATRILKLSAVLKLSNEELGPSVQERTPQVRAIISEVASTMTIAELDGSNGRRKLKQTIKTRINDLLRDLSDEAVQDIFFPDFLIQ